MTEQRPPGSEPSPADKSGLGQRFGGLQTVAAAQRSNGRPGATSTFRVLIMTTMPLMVAASLWLAYQNRTGQPLETGLVGEQRAENGEGEPATDGDGVAEEDRELSSPVADQLSDGADDGRVDSEQSEFGQDDPPTDDGAAEQPATTAPEAQTTVSVQTDNTADPDTADPNESAEPGDAPDISWTPPPASLGSGGDLPLSGQLLAGPLANFDSDRNADPGLTLQVGRGLAETDPTKIQRWRSGNAESARIQGRPSLEIWVAIKDFDTSKSGRLLAGLYDCSADDDCGLLTSGSVVFNQSTFGRGFGRVTINMSNTSSRPSAGRSLVLALAVPQNSDDDVWIAYGTAEYPTTFRVRSGL